MLWAWGHLPEGQRKAGEVVLEDKIMFRLKTLPLLIFLHTQLANAFPVPEHLEEKNIKTAEVNGLSITVDLPVVTEFWGWLSLLSLEGQKEILRMGLPRLSITFWDLKDSTWSRPGPGKCRHEDSWVFSSPRNTTVRPAAAGAFSERIFYL